MFVGSTHKVYLCTEISALLCNCLDFSLQIYEI